MSAKVSDMASPKPKRLYQVWKGRNKFCCGGRLVFGPDVTSLFLSIIMIVGPSITFCFQVILKILHHMEHDFDQDITGQPHILGFLALLGAIILTVADMVFLMLTCSRDPGIVPRNAKPLEADEAFDATTPSMEWINGAAPHLRIPRIKEVNINGFIVKVKYCDTCLLYRPPRASHCSICNNCVQKFDHHCPWVGQCIGLRNYRSFFMFISTSTLLCLYVFTFSWLNVIEEKKNYNNMLLKSLAGEGLSLGLIVYTFVAVWFVGGLTILHLYLISTNQTTYENFRYRYDKKENPFNKGALNNFKQVFCSKLASSLNDFRSLVCVDLIESDSHTTNSESKIFFSKVPTDVEVGRRYNADANPNLPDILRNLDYSSIEDIHPFAFPVMKEHIVDEHGDSRYISNRSSHVQ